jgi:hypothetical protein
MSRSVTTPGRRSPSTIGTIPASSSRITRAAWTTLAEGSTVRGLVVMTSRTFMAMIPPFIAFKWGIYPRV